ncbi:alveolin domain containing intermediate filament IMC3 [Cardiosporidium cionae]|uniref:Alveolin domain containing intermediate filament IMC3 n=1 Tax=Cardiosporidium cionae TaxID=476202 RepID=A0ABQ7JEF4_9APIC|nr:alveolin domain containing intermediate filament IMC3 [Cardiosporidium cionae]|eukprot:KAF8822285.1 alveolin domain containing intermediate filament IMC3 [Cardiosporidium cionae]
MDRQEFQTTDEKLEVTVQGIPSLQKSSAVGQTTGRVGQARLLQNDETATFPSTYSPFQAHATEQMAGEIIRNLQSPSPVSAPFPVPQQSSGIKTSGNEYRIANEFEQSGYHENEGDGTSSAKESTTPLPQNLHVARPPPHVMTPLGPMSLPPEIRQKIPEKFVAKPIIEEREIFVAKKEIQERTIEIPHIQYDHKFSKIPKTFKIKKLVPSVKEIVREIPREVYKPVIEEKVIEVPQGVKYVEVPVEVPCLYPPKIVPRPIEQIVERVVETIKPIVKEKIIEVPQTVVKNVPKIKTVEVPYFVPRYVEKLIEVPYDPPTADQFLPPLTSRLPPSIHGSFPAQTPVSHLQSPSAGGLPFPPSFAGAPTPFTLGPMPLSGVNEIKLPYEAKVEVKITQPEHAQEFRYQSVGQGQIPNKLEASASQLHNVPLELPEGIKWGAPPNVSHPPFGVETGFSNYPSTGKMPPLMVTFPPEVGHVSFSGGSVEPDILTKIGVLPYQGFKESGNAQFLFPPLAPHSTVPTTMDGSPDIVSIDAASKFTGVNPLQRRSNQNVLPHEERIVKKSTCNFFDSNCCSS